MIVDDKLSCAHISFVYHQQINPVPSYSGLSSPDSDSSDINSIINSMRFLSSVKNCSTLARILEIDLLRLSAQARLGRKGRRRRSRKKPTADLVLAPEKSIKNEDC